VKRCAKEYDGQRCTLPAGHAGGCRFDSGGVRTTVGHVVGAFRRRAVTDGGDADARSGGEE